MSKFTYSPVEGICPFSNTLRGIDTIDLMLLDILKLQNYFWKYNDSASFQKLKNIKKNEHVAKFNSVLWIQWSLVPSWKAPRIVCQFPATSDKYHYEDYS